MTGVHVNLSRGNNNTGGAGAVSSVDGGHIIDHEVLTKDDLPNPATADLNDVYLVQTSTGIWPFTKKAGLYKSNGTDWIRLGITAAEIQQLVQSWEYFATNWDVEPVLSKSISGGDVYLYVLNSVNRYRFVPNPYDSKLDCFYGNFNPSTDTLTNSLICRGF